MFLLVCGVFSGASRRYSLWPVLVTLWPLLTSLINIFKFGLLYWIEGLNTNILRGNSFWCKQYGRRYGRLNFPYPLILCQFWKARFPPKQLHGKKMDHFQLVRLPDMISPGISALENMFKQNALENINKGVSSPGLIWFWEMIS